MLLHRLDLGLDAAGAKGSIELFLFFSYLQANMYINICRLIVLQYFTVASGSMDARDAYTYLTG